MTDIRATTELTETLAAIARWYPATADPPRNDASQIRVAYASKPPAPADVISARRVCVDTLTSLALVVAEELDLHPNRDAGDVDGLTSFLSLHAAWIVDNDPDAQYELHRVATELEQIVKQTRPARVPLGRCPEVDPDTLQPCPGEMTATVRRSDDLLPSAIRCSELPRDHVWEPHDWPALGRRIVRHDPVAVAALLASLGARSA